MKLILLLCAAACLTLAEELSKLYFKSVCFYCCLFLLNGEISCVLKLCGSTAVCSY